MRRSFRRFAADAQHPADRRAQFLVLAVDAAKPTTRPPLPLQQFGLQSLDVLAPRFCCLWPEHPADPFIAGKRGEVFPRSENLWVGNQDASQRHRDFMYHSAGDRPGAHRSPIVAEDAVEGSLEAGAAPGVLGVRLDPGDEPAPVRRASTGRGRPQAAHVADPRHQQVKSPGSGTCTASPVIRRESKKLIKSLNIYHQAERIQKWVVNDPERTRGRKYHLSFSNTFETVAGSRK